jgi:enterochelin esterase-like enzyme
VRAFAHLLICCAATIAGGCAAGVPAADARRDEGSGRAAPELAAGAGTVSLAGPSPGRFVTYEAFPSRHVTARKVVVWLPDDYESSRERYAVLYMHDGQNLHDPATAMGGEPWAVERHVTALRAAGRIRPTIVVGVWNSATRARDYAPDAALADVPEAVLREGRFDGPLQGEAYVRFLAEELKPFVDAHYRTRPGREDTFVMGSSRGGLISLYALVRRPDVYGGAGCLSTHWPLAGSQDVLQGRTGPRAGTTEQLASAYIAWLGANLPPPGHHRLYFDHGTEHLDAFYGPYQQRVDTLLAARSYRPDVDVMTRVFPGTAHNEAAWRARLALPLEFLLRP